MTDFNKKNMNELLDVVSRKLGVPKEQLRSELEAGKFDSALKNMKPSEEAMFNRIVSNPTALEQFMSSPQATIAKAESASIQFMDRSAPNAVATPFPPLNL